MDRAAIDPNPTLGEFVHEAAGEFLHWDGKLATTFRLLFTQPGELTREYLAGRRASYLSPLRLYLTCSVLFFALKALAPEPRVVVRCGHVAGRDGSRFRKTVSANRSRRSIA